MKIWKKLVSIALCASMLGGVGAAALTEPILGDIDSSEEVNVSDAVLLARIIVGDKDVVYDRDNVITDLTCDGKTDSEDLTLMLKYLAKKVDFFDVQQPAPKQTCDLMENIEAATVQDKQADDAFILSQNDFATKLLSATLQDTETNENMMLSPLSVSLALAMTANGAKGETRAEMEKLLGGDIPLEELNAYYYTLMNSMGNTELAYLLPANSIWIRDDESMIQVPEEFLQTNANYYDAGAYLAPFDDTTLNDINSWIDAHTNHLIPNMVKSIPDRAVMYLVNTLAFEGEWMEKYDSQYNVSEGIFTAADGSEQTVDYMHSTESKCLDYGGALGFVKPYNGNYSFAGILPPEGMTATEYAASLTGETLTALLQSQEYRSMIYASLPKFTFDFTANLEDTLPKLGMSDAFVPGAADFTGLNSIREAQTCIGKVTHSTKISVTEEGTKASAGTVVEKLCGACPGEPTEIYLTKPFVFMILAKNQGYDVPVFIGVVNSIPEE